MADELICLSGGARGSDVAWGDATKLRGGGVIHYSFPGHRHSAREEDVCVLTDEQLRRANEPLLFANRTLKRTNPLNRPFPVLRLLQRNWWQVVNTDAVYAIVQAASPDGTVDGGTGWAVQMYRDRFEQDAPGAIPLYVFDQTRRRWLRGTTGTTGLPWLPVDLLPARPRGSFAGIGTRKLNADGQRAINEVWG